MNRTFWGALICSVSLVQLLTALPAWADWEYTRWGMTVQEVLEASEGQAVLLDSEAQTVSADNQKTLLKSQVPWRLEDQFSFDVLFKFSGEEPQLSEILLVSSDNNEEMGPALIRRYGPPNRAVSGGLMRVDRSSGAIPDSILNGGEARCGGP